MKPAATVFKVVNYKDLKSKMLDQQVQTFVRGLIPKLEQECRQGPVSAGSLFEALMSEAMPVLNGRLDANILNHDRNAPVVPPWKMWALIGGHLWDCRTAGSTKMEVEMLRAYVQARHPEAAACVLSPKELHFLRTRLTMAGSAQRAPVSATYVPRVDPFAEQQHFVGGMFRKAFLIFACSARIWATLDDWHIGSRSRHLVKKLKKVKAEGWGFTLDVIVVAPFKLPVAVRIQEKLYNQDNAVEDMMREMLKMSGMHRSNVTGLLLCGDQGYTRGQVPKLVTGIGAGCVSLHLAACDSMSIGYRYVNIKRWPARTQFKRTAPPPPPPTTIPNRDWCTGMLALCRRAASSTTPSSGAASVKPKSCQRLTASPRASCLGMPSSRPGTK